MEKKARVQLHQIKGVSPIFNIKSTLVVCEGTDYVFLFGGFDELDNLDSNVYLLNLRTMSWEVDESYPGLYREGHSATYVGGGNVLVFGGVPCDEFPESDVSSVRRSRSRLGVRKDCSMLYYNIFDRKWTEAPDSAFSNAPSPRSRHACCLSEESTKLYVSGGLIDSAPLDDIHCYDIESGVWSEPVQFVPRFDHHIIVYDDRIYAFGGLDKDMNHVIDTVVFLDLLDGSIGEFNTLVHPLRERKLFKPIFSSSTNDELSSTDNNAQNSFPFVGWELVHLNINRTSSCLLNVGLPRWNSPSRDVKVSRFDFKKMQSTNLLEDNYLLAIFNRNGYQSFDKYFWKHAFVAGSLFLLGGISSARRTQASQLNTGVQHEAYNSIDESMDDIGHEEHSYTEESGLDLSNDRGFTQTFSSHLTNVLELDLRSLGVNPVSSEASSSLPQHSKDFEAFLLSEDFTDFSIYALDTDGYVEGKNHNIGFREPIEENKRSVIRVHQSILMARWPHFKRLIESGMNEAINNEMFIPEPYKWIKALIYYLYTGTVMFQNYIPDFNAVDYSGLLVLSNLYELEQLRSEIVSIMFQKIHLPSLATEEEDLCEYLIKIWKNLSLVDEAILSEHVIHRIKVNWRSIIRSKVFEELPKQLIIQLCQECTGNGPAYNTKDDSFNSLRPTSPTNGEKQASEPNTPAKRASSSSSLFFSPQTPNDSVTNGSPGRNIPFRE